MKKNIIILFVLIVLTVIPFMYAFPQPADKNLIKAGMLANMKLYDEAYAAISEVEITSKTAVSVSAEIQYGLKNYQQAIELYNRAENNTPGLYRLELAKCYAMQGNKAKAMEYLSAYFKSGTKLPVSKVINDEAFIRYKHDADWEKMWQYADYSELELKINQVNSASEIGYNEQFNHVLDEALKKYPSNSELLYQQSRFYENRKMLDAAQKSINQALTQRSGNDVYHYQKSIIQLKNNNLKDALASVNNAISKNPFPLRYYTQRIEVNRALGAVDKVNEDVKFLEFCVPENTEVRLVKAQAEADKGNYLLAINELDELIQKDQTQPTYYILRGKMGLKTQRIVNADEDFGMALDLNPNDAEANLGKGIAKYNMEDFAAACYYWQKATHEGSREALDYLNKYCRK